MVELSQLFATVNLAFCNRKDGMQKTNVFEAESLTRVLQAGGNISEAGNTVAISSDRIAALFAELRLETIQGFLRRQRKAGIRTVRYYANSQADNSDVSSNVAWMVDWMIDDGQLREEDRDRASIMLREMIVDIIPLTDERLHAVCAGGYSVRDILAPRTDLERQACRVLYRAIAYLQTFSTGTLTDEGKQHIAQIYGLASKIPPILAGDRFHDAELDMSLRQLEYLMDCYGGSEYRAWLVQPIPTWKENANRWVGFGMAVFFIGVVVGRLM